MIDAAFCQRMARYNRWQNNSLVREADLLDEDVRAMNRGAFFGSISATLNHLLWGDTIWMSRFDGWEKPATGIPQSPLFTPDWAAFKTARSAADARIIAWAQGLADADLHGDLAWYSGAIGADVVKPRWLCIQHFFNHQTHHRGQIHAMLTAAGGTPGDTDLFLMPETA
ncbi:MAG: DinB family protein [Rhodobacter sp.]|nr:DinB family protein [Rhodobacter sp.]